MTNEEAIKRLKVLTDYEYDEDEEALELAIKALEEERPKGKWEVVSTSEGTHFYGCSECQFAGDISDGFCRRCGAQMVERGSDK